MANRYTEETWDRIKDEYFTGGSTLRDLSDRHSVPLKTIESRYRREGWKRRLNENLQVVKDIATQTLKDRQEVLGERAGDFIVQSAEQLKGLIDDLVERRGNVRSTAEFDKLVDSFATLVRTGRELYGIDRQTEAVPQTLVSIAMNGERINGHRGPVIECLPYDAVE